MKHFRLSLIILLFLLVLGDLFLRVSGIPSGQSFNADSYISIMITVLGVVIAVFIGFLALTGIFGYAGLKEYVRDIVRKETESAVETATQNTMKKYPEAESLFAAVKEIKQHSELLEQMQSQSATVQETPVTDQGIALDDNGKKGAAPPTPLECVNEQTTPIEMYPGEEKDESNGDGGNAIQ